MVQGWGELPEEIIMTMICERFGWTYQEYQNQPWWFLETIKLKIGMEGERAKMEENKLKLK